MSLGFFNILLTCNDCTGDEDIEKKLGGILCNSTSKWTEVLMNFIIGSKCQNWDDYQKAHANDISDRRNNNIWYHKTMPSLEKKW